ncbi:MAG: class I SAM-dependent methyltransferase [Epsilonproteobacteria bacterium]|nr:class I SAM-dependent methyltransferase [Campylobacterota bacterium]
MKGLDLYAKIEYLFDFRDVMEKLWNKYIFELETLRIKSLLDIGCGSGDFMLKAKRKGFNVVGVDISEEMIKISKSKNLEVYHKDVCQCSRKFDACVAIFDVINYMDKEYLESFFECVENVLEDGGYFLFDINTKKGFDIAQGSLVVEDNRYFGVLESGFGDNVLDTKITVFTKKQNCWYKESDYIRQYYYCINELLKYTNLTFVKDINISLYTRNDKKIVILKKRAK